MKTICLFFTFLGTVSPVLAQPSNLVNAYNYKQSGDLDKAQEAIDKAINHEKTKVREKTWRYRGDIYLSIYQSTDPRFSNLSSNPLQVSFESYKKAMELEPADAYVNDITRNLSYMQNLSLSEGVSNYNAGKYNEALGNFVTTVDIAKFLDKTDTLAMLNCGMTAEYAGKPQQALDWYAKCIDLNYKTSNCCIFSISILVEQNRMEEATKMAETCLIKNPDDPDLLVNTININLMLGNYADARTNLEKAISMNPTNEVLHFSLGTVLENLGESDKAIDYYKEALRLNPDYFDANYNAGAYYFNKAVEKNGETLETNDQALLQELEGEVDALFKKSLGYLEKAHELDPRERSTLLSLKQLYAYMNDMENFNRIKALLEN